MGLAAGTRLGPYEIVGALGAGGMGEVYRARDTRLDRSVAIKVLPSELAADPERRARFEREARAVAALDHPHICGIHDVGDVDGTHFLVLPLVEGQTLAARLEKGPLPLDQAIKVATEIADALDKAHRRGIVHRDLKPANIMLTKACAKLLDFGLAKLQVPTGPISLSGMTRLATTPWTAQGTILGTVQYMAPEQVEGKEADARSDIWALGVVLYEMVTGVRPFHGETPASIIGAILKDQPPPVSARIPLAPPALDHLVATCLTKEPDERWQSACDFVRALSWIREGWTGLAPATKARPRVAWLVAGLLLAALAVTTPGWLTRQREARRSPIRLSMALPERAAFTAPPASVVAAQSAISPDGNRIAFVAELPGKRPALWVRELDSSDARALPGTDEALYPFWSPDSRFLGFFAQGKLKTVGLAGGPPTALSDAPLDSRGGTWNQEGTILFAPSSTDVIYRIPSTGGALTPVTTLDKTRAEVSHRFPSFLPDGRHFVYVVRSERPENWGLQIGSLDSTQVKWLTNASIESAQVVPSGHLLYLRGSTLLAQSIDLGSFELEGDPVKIADSVATTATAYAAFSVSRDDTLVYANRADLKGELRWYDRTGAQLDTVGEAAGFLDFELSPDERALAVSRLDEQLNAADVWTVDLARKVWSRLTSDRSNDASVLWSPDGTRLVFRSNRRGLTDAFQKRPSGSAPEEIWFGVGTNLITTDWTQDDRFVVFTNTRAVSGFDIWAWPTSGGAESTLLVRTSLNAVHGRVSPDGRWLAYASDESGQWEVFVQPFPATGEKWKMSARGGSEPRWRRDGRELFFLGSDMVMMSVALANGPSAAGPPVPLFQTRVPLTGNPYRSNYTVSRDGRRFLVNTSTDDGLSAPLTVVLDWQTLLRR